MRWTPEQYNAYMRRVGLRTKVQPDLFGNHETLVYDSGAGQAPKLERHAGDGALAAVQVQKRLGQKFLVRVTSIRNRLLDEDNLAEKFHVDLCRYAGLIPDDRPGQTRIEVCQEKAEPGAAEEVRIEVYAL